jgi:hypothetical protein
MLLCPNFCREQGKIDQSENRAPLCHAEPAGVSGLYLNDRLLVVVMNKQAQVDFVHALALGKGERFAHKTPQALAQRAKPTLGVVGLALGFAAEAMRAPWKGCFTGQPEITAGGKGSDNPAGGASAKRGRSGPSDPPQSRRRSGGSVGKGRSRPNARWLWNP